jgi:hypothetical protein
VSLPTTSPDQASANIYGKNINVFPDIDPRGGLVFGQQLLAQAIYARLRTRPGLIQAWPDYGFDVQAILNAGIDLTRQANLGQLKGQIEKEIEKDDRIASCNVSPSYDPGTFTLTLVITVTPTDSSVAPFAFVIPVTKLSVGLVVGQTG